MEKNHELLVVVLTLPTISIITMLITKYLFKKSWSTAISAACGALIISSFIWRYLISPRL